MNKSQLRQRRLEKCIRYASRLIKIRSELRSPPTLLNNRMKTNSAPILFSEDHVGERSKAQSSPNVNLNTANLQHEISWDNDNESEYDDEVDSEIDYDDLDEEEEDDNMSGQLTYLADLVRRSERRKHMFHTQSGLLHLALPPRQTLYQRHSLDKLPTDQKQRSLNTSGHLYSPFGVTSSNSCPTEDEISPIDNISSSSSSSSSCSSASSYSSLDDEDDVYTQEAPSIAFRVSLSPSAAAAASVARMRRRHVRAREVM